MQSNPQASGPLVRASRRDDVLLLCQWRALVIPRSRLLPRIVRVAEAVGSVGPDVAQLGLFGFHEWPVAFGLLVPHDNEGSDDCDPVNAVGDD